MTWEIVTGIIALFGFLVAVTTPMIKLSKIMTQLTISVENLKEAIKQMGENNTASHKRIWEHMDYQDKQLQEHDKRISILESKK